MKKQIATLFLLSALVGFTGCKDKEVGSIFQVVNTKDLVARTLLPRDDFNNTEIPPILARVVEKEDFFNVEFYESSATGSGSKESVLTWNDCIDTEKNKCFLMNFGVPVRVAITNEFWEFENDCGNKYGLHLNIWVMVKPKTFTETGEYQVDEDIFSEIHKEELGSEEAVNFSRFGSQYEIDGINYDMPVKILEVDESLDFSRALIASKIDVKKIESTIKKSAEELNLSGAIYDSYANPYKQSLKKLESEMSLRLNDEVQTQMLKGSMGNENKFADTTLSVVNVNISGSNQQGKPDSIFKDINLKEKFGCYF